MVLRLLKHRVRSASVALTGPAQVNTGESDMTKAGQIRVLAVDDHALLLEGLATVIENQPDVALVGQASNCKDAIRKFRMLRPDVTLLDLRLPDMSGIDALIAIRSQFPGARIVMMATFEGDGPVLGALQAGARSCIFKTMSPHQILDTIRQVHAGRKYLPREIATKIAGHSAHDNLSDGGDLHQHTTGRTSNGLGARKFLTAEEKVKGHVRSFIQKLEEFDHTRAMMIAARRGFIQL